MLQVVDVTQSGESLLDLGKKQWACIDALAAHYESADMSKISAKSKFEDDLWDVVGAGTYNFRWDIWGKAEIAYPLILVCKVACYHALQVNNEAISSINTSIVGFFNAFGDMLAAKSILTAERNQPFNTLSQLSADDILLIAQTNMATNNTLSIKPYSAIELLFKTIPSAFPHSAFLTAGMSPPWKEQGLTVTSWISGIKTAHGIDTTRKPFSPLKFEALSSLVQRALPFVNEHFDTLVGVFDEIEKFNSANPYLRKTKLNIRVGPIIIKKYGIKLEKILPITTYDSPNESRDGLIMAGWYTELEQLVQAAAAWIILLTTGLRNIDMRHLEKGCCQPSQRYDLLNYLVTDIKKTHLRRYVLPVPPQTLKAIQLVERCKLDRDGRFLFTKNSTHSTDNTTADKRKMDTSESFNKLIKGFASRYDIPLETMSDDGNEATAHCVRATLAGWIGTHSVAAILILKKLFGHSNALMPDAYLSHNPLVIDERNKGIADGIKTMSSDLADAIVRGKVSGKMGKRLLAGAEYIKGEIDSELDAESDPSSPPSSSGRSNGSSQPAVSHDQLTEMDMKVRLKERLQEMLHSRIQDKQVFALKTPMAVICMRNTSNSSDAPCAIAANHEQRKDIGVSKLITDAMGTPPCPANCLGKDCGDALFGDTWSRDLLTSFDYYIKYLQGVSHQSVDIRREAKNFVATYAEILNDLYADEREEGYFA